MLIVTAATAHRRHTARRRSHKLQPDEVGASVRAIARCGAGTNNIPIEEMTAPSPSSTLTLTLALALALALP